MHTGRFQVHDKLTSIASSMWHALRFCGMTEDTFSRGKSRSSIDKLLAWRGKVAMLSSGTGDLKWRGDVEEGGSG